jgi:hypothetical protein
VNWKRKGKRKSIQNSCKTRWNMPVISSLGRQRKVWRKVPFKEPWWEQNTKSEVE